jgi:diacylglycerol O-acyltransferase / wax synthase
MAAPGAHPGNRPSPGGLPGSRKNPGDVEAIPLSREDQAILALESDTVVGHTCKVVSIGEGAPDVGVLRESVAARISAAPLLTRRLGGTDDAPAWVPDERFEISSHIGDAPVDASIDRDRIPEVVASLFEQHLDRRRPLWRIDRIPLRGGGAVLAWRIHHAIADGTTAMRYAGELLWDPDPDPRPDAPPARTRAADDERRRGHLAGFVERELVRSKGASPFDGRIGTRRRVAFASVPLRALHDAGHELAGASLNDAVLAMVAGAIRRWIEYHHSPLGTVRVKVPVSLHHQGEDSANRDSFFCLELPLNEPDPVARLHQVREATAVRKADHDAETMDRILRDLSRISPRLERFSERIEASPRVFALNVSNVPGPRRGVSVLGASVGALHSIAEIGERHALRIAVVSLADRLCLAVCADPGIVDDLEVMRDGLELEAEALIASAS